MGAVREGCPEEVTHGVSMAAKAMKKGPGWVVFQIPESAGPGDSGGKRTQCK